MTAFVSFVRVYAIWIYLLCAFGFLAGLKLLSDARRLARTTLFSLEQERAAEQFYRSVILIFVTVFATGLITAVNLIGPALVPLQEPAILHGATPTILAITFPSDTPPATATFTPPATEAPTAAATAVITATATRIARSTPAPVLSATPTPPLPAPVVSAPPNGNVFQGYGQKNAALTFRWTWDCSQCQLGPNDRFVIVINYNDSAGRPVSTAGGTRDDFLSMGSLIQGLPPEQDLWHKAQQGKYQWYVQVKRGEQPLTPPSDASTFVWD